MREAEGEPPVPGLLERACPAAVLHVSTRETYTAALPDPVWPWSRLLPVFSLPGPWTLGT